MGLFLCKYYSLHRKNTLLDIKNKLLIIENKSLNDKYNFLYTENDLLKNKYDIVLTDNNKLIDMKNINQMEMDKYKYAINNYIKRIDYLDNLVEQYNIPINNLNNTNTINNTTNNSNNNKFEFEYSNFINDIIDKFKV